MKLLKTNTQTHIIDKHRKKQRRWDTSLCGTPEDKERGERRGYYTINVNHHRTTTKKRKNHVRSRAYEETTND
jgi:hypothetical protein